MLSGMNPDEIPVGQPWSGIYGGNGYRCTAVKRMTPMTDNGETEWVVVAHDGRSFIGEFPGPLELVAPIAMPSNVRVSRRHTPVRNFRIPDSVYEPAREVAAAAGETITDVVTRNLILYTERANPQPQS